MRITELSVKNYKALQDVTIPISRFGCLIGENNAGKSSILQAFALFLSGDKLTANKFYDESQPIEIGIAFNEICETDLAKLAEEHRNRITGIVKKGQLHLVRRYSSDGSTLLYYRALMPKEPRFEMESVATLVKNQRAGQKFFDKVVAVFPELASVINTTMNQEDIKRQIQILADSYPDNEKISVILPIPTGKDISIIPMLPEPIYIPAVKDLADDIKTTQSTPFGKILSILLQVIEPKLPNTKEIFEEINTKLNRVQQSDGKILDNRLDEIKLIEATVEKYVHDSFKNVKLSINIPPPELKTIFSSAKILADDGVIGDIDTKGDGLRRAVIFSILRTYVELKEKLIPAPEPTKDAISTLNHSQSKIASYLLLFEEPELFLHPKAQHLLFDALKIFAKDHHVLVTTHSPMFFSPEATETFIKLCKVSEPATHKKPFTRAHPIDLSDIRVKDQFQIICFENNNAAFFSDTVVLVEGDSDYILLPHIAKTLNPVWDTSTLPVVFAKILGKGNISRYRIFFSKFNIKVAVISDLDLLVNGFNQIAIDDTLKTGRDRLLARVDEIIASNSYNNSGNGAKKAHDSGELRGLWQQVRQRSKDLKEGKCTQNDLNQAVEAFYAWQQKDDRLDVLKHCTDQDFIQQKHQFLEQLREYNIYILERGAIEQYYPNTIIGGDDKPLRAQDFCSKINKPDIVLSCCNEQSFIRKGKQIKEKEFNLIFSGIFSTN